MDKRKQIIELIKEDSWHNIPVENTVDKIFSILSVVGQNEQLVCDKCKMPYTKEEIQVGHCFNCGEMD